MRRVPVWFFVGFGGFQVVWGAVLLVIGAAVGFVNIALGAACLLFALYAHHSRARNTR